MRGGGKGGGGGGGARGAGEAGRGGRAVVAHNGWWGRVCFFGEGGGSPSVAQQLEGLYTK
jgi:hypothetical protein